MSDTGLVRTMEKKYTHFHTVHHAGNRYHRMYIGDNGMCWQHDTIKWVRTDVPATAPAFDEEQIPEDLVVKLSDTYTAWMREYTAKSNADYARTVNATKTEAPRQWSDVHYHCGYNGPTFLEFLWLGCPSGFVWREFTNSGWLRTAVRVSSLSNVKQEHPIERRSLKDLREALAIENSRQERQRQERAAFTQMLSVPNVQFVQFLGLSRAASPKEMEAAHLEAIRNTEELAIASFKAERAVLVELREALKNQQNYAKHRCGALAWIKRNKPTEGWMECGGCQERVKFEDFNVDYVRRAR